MGFSRHSFYRYKAAVDEVIEDAVVAYAIAEHHAVLEVAVFGIPRERWGETPCAVIVSKPGVSITENEVTDLCAALLWSYKKPGKIVFSDQPLPKTPVGKIKGRELREPYWAGQGRRIGGT